MPRFVVELDTSEVRAAMARLDQATSDFRELLAGMVALSIQGMVDEAFQNQGRPGKPWQPLHPDTLARRRKGKKKSQSDQILIDTGRLRQSVAVEDNYQVDSHSLSVGSNLIYARIHQFGGKIRRKTPRARRAERLLEAYGARQSMASRLVEGRRAAGPHRISEGLQRRWEKQAKERGSLISTIPARPYLPDPLTDDERGEIEFALIHYLTQRLQGEEGP